jgi:hypothetical protein
MWDAKVINRRTRTGRIPRGSTVEYVVDVVENDPENPTQTHKKINRHVEQHKPVPPGKPVTRVSVTGAIFDQFIGAPPPQGQDPHWWSEEMLDSSEEELVSTVDNEDGTRTVTTTRVSTDPDGNMREEILTETSTIEPESDDRTEATKTVTSPSETVKTVTLYNTQGTVKNKVTTRTLKFDPYEGTSESQVTEVTETTEDEFGKIVEKYTKTTLQPQTGIEDVEELETILNPGADKISYERTINRDPLTGIESTDESMTITDGYGVSRTTSRNHKKNITKQTTTVTTTKADTLDSIVDDMIDAYVVTEYELAGDLMSMPQVFKIKNKCDQHQLAWGFLQLREQQLELGDRISPAMRAQLWREWQSVFLGEPTETLKGGPVLDRIECYIFGETGIPAVFPADQGAFPVEWIPGSYGLFTWSMKLQTYTKLVRSKDGTFRQEVAGGVYGRVDSSHWLGGSVNETFEEDTDRFKSVEEGGQWQYL